VSKRNDISQLIHKYLNGELDAHAMHQLEKEAQNDPFLMEALEGYEQSEANQQQNLADVYARLHDRTHKAERRIIPWRIIAIAASILIVLTIGGLWLRHQSPETAKTFVKISKPKQAPPLTKPSGIDTPEAIITATPIITNQIAKNKPHTISRSTHNAAPNINADNAMYAPALADAKVRETKKDTTSLGEVTVIGYGTQKKSSITASVQTISPGYLKGNPSPVNNELSGRVAGVTVFKDINNSISGTVTAKEDGQPMPGVTVKIKGTSLGTQTDANGHFIINAVPGNSVLIFAMVGYLPKEVPMGNKNLLAVNLQASNNSLDEVVVTNAYGIKQNGDDEQQVYESAHPVNGWGDFKKYLKERAVSPDGKTGVVKVSFTVNSNDRLSDFKILKGLSEDANNTAIQIITNGPAWITNSDRKTEVVKVRVKFAKPE
jgi:hypothetical protein